MLTNYVGFGTRLVSLQVKHPLNPILQAIDNIQKRQYLKWYIKFVIQAAKPGTDIANAVCSIYFHERKR